MDLSRQRESRNVQQRYRPVTGPGWRTFMSPDQLDLSDDELDVLGGMDLSTPYWGQAPFLVTPHWNSMRAFSDWAFSDSRLTARTPFTRMRMGGHIDPRTLDPGPRRRIGAPGNAFRGATRGALADQLGAVTE